MKTVKAKARPVKASPDMNKLERRYAEHLERMRMAGKILHWKAHPGSLKLGPNLHYRPDFFVVALDGTLEVHETKGYMRDDAQVKIRAAAEIFPWLTFRLVYFKIGRWDITEVGN